VFSLGLFLYYLTGYLIDYSSDDSSGCFLVFSLGLLLYYYLGYLIDYSSDDSSGCFLVFFTD